MAKNENRHKRAADNKNYLAMIRVFTNQNKLSKVVVREDTHHGEGIYGRKNNERVFQWVNREYINLPTNFEKYKVFLPAANGSGAIGEALSTPIVGDTFIGHTATFISIGEFEIEQEAENCLKYLKSKFCRTMLGIKKTTQHNKTKKVWECVPNQDFTKNSEVDWSKSIPEIDQQLYKKYKLSKEEIAFIKENVQPMA